MDDLDEPDIESTTNDQQSKSTIVNPKTRIIRRPRNILRVDHFVSRRGIAALPEILSQTKFKGKGHELEDLKLLLFKTKHWAHRLFPGLTFEDFVTKAEHLGNKKTVKNFLNRIRTNQSLYFADDHQMIHSDNDGNGSGDDDNDQQQQRPKTQKLNDDGDGDQAARNFDLLFRDHIEEMKSNISNNKNDNDNNDRTINRSTTKSNQDHHVDNDFMEDVDDIDYDDIVADKTDETSSGNQNEKNNDEQIEQTLKDNVDDQEKQNQFENIIAQKNHPE
uniref:TIMELESS-interacting protein n=1 Tax=Dermatophagoides pteronyssinus TaxID=6956 RepID=A0A6P6XPI5_DERPT|nr:TIMELESS-interacting protein-like [Dermatophagoides pteronyssinus]